MRVGESGAFQLGDDLLGRGLAAQIVSLGTALAAGAVVYGAGITAMRIPEAAQIRALVRRRQAS